MLRANPQTLGQYNAGSLLTDAEDDASHLVRSHTCSAAYAQVAIALAGACFDLMP